MTNQTKEAIYALPEFRESYLRWTLSDWAMAIDYECGYIEARRSEGVGF